MLGSSVNVFCVNETRHNINYDLHHCLPHDLVKKKTMEALHVFSLNKLLGFHISFIPTLVQESIYFVR